MAARVDESEVRAIITTELTSITAFINTAHLMVDELLASAGYSEDRLKEIELYLSAHLLCANDPRVSQEKIGESSNTYQMAKGELGLNSTAFGQTVSMLDTSGLLVDSVKPKAGLACIRTSVAPG